MRPVLLLFLAACVCSSAELPPLVIVLGEPQRWTPPPGWQRLEATEDACTDAGVKAVETKLLALARKTEFDGARIYLVGRIDAVLYTIARTPDLWAAAVANGGNAAMAIETGKLYAANFSLVPILWRDAAETPVAERLQAGGVRIDRRAASEKEIWDFLATHHREAFPARVDCETGNPSFARCYWIQPTKFDASRRNDVLHSTRLAPGTRASLALELKPGERIVAIGGKHVRDAADHARIMDEMREERPIAVMVEHGRERRRVETRVVVPKREEVITSRVRAEYEPAMRELQIVSRTVVELRLLVPQAWEGATINWNGQEMGRDVKTGCWVLGVTMAPCP